MPIIIRAIADFKKAYNKTLSDIESFNAFLVESGLYRQFNEKQKIVFQVAKSWVAKEFTATNVSDNLGCSYNTAASVLNDLVELGLLTNRAGNGCSPCWIRKESSRAGGGRELRNRCEALVAQRPEEDGARSKRRF